MIGSYTHLRNVSNPITYDALLVHHLARELDAALRQRRLRDVAMSGSGRRLVLTLDDVAYGWELHPDRGWIRALDAPPVRDPDARSAAGRVTLPRQARVAAVEAPPDERVLYLTLSGSGRGRTRRLAVELMTNQWNALALDGDGRITAVLWPRDAGVRRLRPGVAYTPPSPGQPRSGRDAPLPRAAWLETLAPVPPGERRRELVRRVAWTSPLNAGAILGEAATDPGAEALRAAHERYASLAPPDTPSPCVLELENGLAVYPVPLPGVASRPTPSLVAAMDEVAAAGAGAPAEVVTPEALDRLRRRRDALERRVERLQGEADGAPGEAATLRHQGDVLLARLAAVRKGMARAELEDFDGSTVEVELDPKLVPAENAEALYDRAARRERAAEKLPAIVAESRTELEAVRALLDAVEAGTADPERVRRAVSELEADRDKGARRPGRSLPYRRYRTSGGLEVRVGRGKRANDDLTFHHASPDDIWLHARDVAGAHVVLRWPHRDQNPPRRDLHEAATLAAWHSKARTSSTVPVDWTRRKYVRKPRKAPPGRVVLDRVETVFVEPAATVEKRLRAP